MGRCRIESKMEITNTIDIGNYVVTHDLPSGNTLVGDDLDYIGIEEEHLVELEFEEGTV